VRVLVTGAAGFIGSHLCEALVASGDRVVGLDSFEPAYHRRYKDSNIEGLRRAAGFELLEEDVRNLPDKPVAADAVVHLAALADMRHSLLDPVSYTRINIDGTLAVLESARRAGIRNVVYASSSLVYGNRTDVPFKETDPVNAPVSLYAATKGSGELLCRVYQGLYGMNVTCLRFFTVFGPRQRPDMAIHKFASRILKDREIPVFGHGRVARDYVYVGDVVDAICRSLQRMGGFQTFNVGSGKADPLMAVIGLLETGLGMKARLRFEPEQPGDVPITFASVDAAAAQLGFRAREPLASGMKRFVAWYLATGRNIELELEQPVRP
jgi:UDP-glucuronate 4-epimerase